MLLIVIDGARYELWTPPSEDEFERMVKEHSQDIFGEQSIYFDTKQKLKSLSGIGSIPDGYVLSFQEPPCWYICEVELHTHSLYEHIVPQVTKFINGVKSFETQREIINALDREISGDPLKEAQVINKTGSREVYRFIANLISKPPVLAILIDQITNELGEVCDSLPIEVKVVEFQTFVREGVGLAVHAHLFEPLYKPVIPIKPYLPLETGQGGNFVVSLQPAFPKYPLIPIRREHRRLFPGFKEPFILETDQGNIKTWVAGGKNAVRGNADAGAYLRAGIPEWYSKYHPELGGGSKVRIRVVEPMKKYRLEIVK